MDMDAIALSNLDGVGALPGLNLQFVMESLATVFLASLRVGAFLIASPFLRHIRTVATTNIMAVLLGVAVQHHRAKLAEFDAMTGFLVILTELAIGIGAGLILTIWFVSPLAGEKIATSSGLAAAQIDPDSGGTPVVSKIFQFFNSFILVLERPPGCSAGLDTYQFMPVGSLPNIDALVSGGITAAGSMFFAAAIIMLPITGFLVAINLAVGVISRSSPQMNLFAVGFPISMIVIFVLLYLWVDALGHSLTELSQTGVESVTSVLEVMING